MIFVQVTVDFECDDIAHKNQILADIEEAVAKGDASLDDIDHDWSDS